MDTTPELQSDQLHLMKITNHVGSQSELCFLAQEPNRRMYLGRMPLEVSIISPTVGFKQHTNEVHQRQKTLFLTTERHYLYNRKEIGN